MSLRRSAHFDVNYMNQALRGLKYHQGGRELCPTAAAPTAHGVNVCQISRLNYNNQHAPVPRTLHSNADSHQTTQRLIMERLVTLLFLQRSKTNWKVFVEFMSQQHYFVSHHLA